MKRLNALLPRRYGLHLERGLYRVVDLRSHQWLGEWTTLASLQTDLTPKAAPAWRRDSVDIVITDAQSRSAALKRPMGIRSAGELATVHRARFEALFGDGQRWQVRLQPQSPVKGTPQAVDIVVGVHAEWLASMLRTFEQLRWTPRRLVPRWLAWADRWASHWRVGNHWLVAADTECVTLALFSEGRCLSVRQQRLADLTIEDLLARESALLSPAVEPAQVWVAGLGRCTDFSQRPHQTGAEDEWPSVGTGASPVRERQA